MPALVKTSADIPKSASKATSAPNGLGPMLRALIEQEQAGVIALIREEERVSAEERARAEENARSATVEAATGALRGAAEVLKAATGEAAASALSATEALATPISQVGSDVRASASRVTKAVDAMAEKLESVLTAALNERMADVVEALAVLRAEVQELKARKPVPYLVHDIVREGANVVQARFDPDPQ